jgi:dTDP-4-dehydrorhamnose 3,5-epimerase-like enzyme
MQTWNANRRIGLFLKITDKEFPYFDKDGVLVPIEFSSLPFVPKRVFVVKDVPVGVERGNHAHFLTRQFLVCLSGRINVKLYDGKSLYEHEITPFRGMLVDSMIWDSQVFLEEDTELLVLCSTPYDPDDYITDMDMFKKIVGDKK